MNIAFIIPSMGGGGAERVIAELANEFVKQNHTVSIVTTKNPICVYSLEEPVKLIDISKKKQGFISRILSIRKFINHHKFDVLISFLNKNNIETILANTGNATPLIISERNNPYTSPNKKLYKILRTLTYGYADGFVFQTDDARDYFNNSIRNRSIVIMNPIKANLPKVHNSERRKRIVNVGRLVKQKNQKLFIDAFCEFSKTHKDYTAEIYGEGPLEKTLLHYIKEKNMCEKILLKGFSNDVLNETKDASMFVMTSDYEGMSNALIEAVGMGIPSISTDSPIGGARMTIEDGKSGFLVPVNDLDTLVNKMSLIADNTDLAQSISVNGCLLRETLSVQKIAQKWLNYIYNIFEKSRR